MSDLLRAFSHRNYRYYWTGFALSLVGTWMQTLAQGWLVWRLTESSMWLGIIGAMPQVPSLLLGSIGGVLVDRLHKRGLLLVTQTGMAACALALAIPTMMGVVTVPEVLVISIILGIFMAIDSPARLSFVTEIVGVEDTGNAIALNSTTFNATRLIGPAIAGLLVPLIGEGGCFLINAISFLAFIVGLLMMRDLPKPVKQTSKPIGHQWREAFTYIRNSVVHRSLILNVMVFSAIGMSYAVLMPVFADKILHAGVRGMGMLMGATGIGAIIGGIWQAHLPRGSKRGKVVMMGTAGLGASVLCFSFSPYFALSLFILMFTGFFSISMLASTNTLLQTLSPDHLRGRVLGFYTASFMGVMPIGSFIVGWSSSVIGPQITLTIGSLICLLVAWRTILQNEQVRAV
jgi:MFS family permease